MNTTFISYLLQIPEDSRTPLNSRTLSISLSRLCCVLVATLLLSSPLYAHHASKFFEMNDPVWISGTVVSFEAVNPHARVVLDVIDADGTTNQWTIEGPRLRRMAMIGVDKDFLVPGESIRFCAFLPNAEIVRRQIGENSILGGPRFLHGHLVEKADGQQWLWGPYGNLATCVDPQDWDTINHGQWPLPER